MTITLHARPRTQSCGTLTKTRCPLCRDELREAEVRAGACGHCPECETRYHRECFVEFGGCSTMGCSAYRQPLLGAPASARATCSACWDEDALTALSRCPGCSARVHAHCFDQEGCRSRGCSYERGPARLGLGDPSVRRRSSPDDNERRSRLAGPWFG